MGRRVPRPFSKLALMETASPLRFRAPTLVGFGASTMQGAGDDPAHGGAFRRLAALVPGAERQYVNLGIGGNTTTDMLARVEACQAIVPRDVIVILGCNDLPRTPDGSPHRRTTLTAYAENLNHIFKAI